MSVAPVDSRPARDRLRIAAPSHESAVRLTELLERCHCLIVQDGGRSWTVTAQPWEGSGRALVEALSSVERWLGETGVGVTRVMVGERRFTLAAP